MQLIDDEILERRRDEAGFVPWKIGPPDDAVPRIPLQLARVGVAFMSAARLADYPEFVSVAVLRALHEPPPMAAARTQQLRMLAGRPADEVADDVNFASLSAPDAERCAVRDKVGPHGRVAVEVIARNPGHVASRRYCGALLSRVPARAVQRNGEAGGLGANRDPHANLLRATAT